MALPFSKYICYNMITELKHFFSIEEDKSLFYDKEEYQELLDKGKETQPENYWINTSGSRLKTSVFYYIVKNRF